MSSLAAVILTFAPALVGAVACLAVEAFAGRRAGVALAAAGLVLGGAAGLYAGTAARSETVFGAVRAGGLFSAVPGLVLLLSGAVLAGGWREYTQRDGGGAAAGLVALAAAASGLVAAAFDLTVLLVALETAALCAYALVSEARTSAADEAAMKYFVQGAVATGALVLGFAVLVGAFAPGGGYAALVGALQTPEWPSAAIAASVLVFAALAFKMGAAPFHSWAPDAYQSARPEVSAFLSTGPKLAAICSAAVFVTVVSAGAISREMVLAIAVLAFASVVLGSLLALRQRSFARMLGYAGVAQAGYALIGAALLRPEMAVFFGATYALATTGAFMSGAAFKRVDPEWDGSIGGLAGMGRRAPVVSVALAGIFVSLAGIPPFLGFWGKFQLFIGAGLAGINAVSSDALLGWTYLLLAAIGVLASVVSLGYYGGVMRALFLDPAAHEEGTMARSAGGPGAVVALVALLVLALGIVPLFAGLSAIAAPFVLR